MGVRVEVTSSLVDCFMYVYIRSSVGSQGLGAL